MSGKFLLDSNIILGTLKGNPVITGFIRGVDAENLHVSVISEMELLSFHGITPDEERSIRDFLDNVSIVPLNGHVENIAIRLRRETRRKLPDAIVAASALYRNAVLVTCDRELAGTNFPGLKTLNPAETA